MLHLACQIFSNSGKQTIDEQRLHALLCLKQMIGMIQSTRNLQSICPEQAEGMWVSDNGQFSVAFTRFRAATVQQICIPAVVKAAI